jgi:two-component system LytT family sensor kinase
LFSVDAFLYMFTHRYRYYLALFLSVYTYLNTEFCNVYEHFGIEISWYYACATIFLITFSTLEINRLVEPLLKKRIHPEHNTFRFPLVFFLCSGLIASMVTTIVVLTMGMLVHDYPFSQNVTPLKLNLTYVSLVNLLYHLINTVIYYYKSFRIKQQQAETLKKLNSQAELQLIKSQINPHFLFNNLNVLSALVMKNTEDANKFIEVFSNVYRYVLTAKEAELVDLSTELEHINEYVFLLEKRFGTGLKVNINANAASENYYLIPAALQLLVENAIKHNIISKVKPLTIDIATNTSNQIVVTNNLQRKAHQEPSSQIGLNSIIKRYRLLAKDEVLINNDGIIFSVALPLLQTNKIAYGHTYR